MTTEIQLNIKKAKESIIKAIGVGGGGCNAINHMQANHIEDVEYIVCNTDKQSLDKSNVKKKLQIGINLTEGLGAGADPSCGQNAALESKEDVRTMLDNTKMLFITAGMGGGTGTGAAPVIASIAKEMGILVIGIVTAPFRWEGPKKIEKAKTGIEELKKNCDSTIVILNDKVIENYPEAELNEGFKYVDEVLLISAKGIADIITKPGKINLDFRDVNTTMSNSITTLIGSAVAEGSERAIEAVKKATESPLTDTQHINGAKRALVSIVSGSSSGFKMMEMDTINKYIEDKTGGAELIIGFRNDEELGDKIEVTVIITGFEDSKSPLKKSFKKQESIIKEEEKDENQFVGGKIVISERAKKYLINVQKKEKQGVNVKEAIEKSNSQSQYEKNYVDVIPKNVSELMSEKKDTTDILQDSIEESENSRYGTNLTKANISKQPSSAVSLDERNEKIKKLEEKRKKITEEVLNNTYKPSPMSKQKAFWQDPYSRLGKQTISEDGIIEKSTNYLHDKAD